MKEFKKAAKRLPLELNRKLVARVEKPIYIFKQYMFAAGDTSELLFPEIIPGSKPND